MKRLNIITALVLLTFTICSCSTAEQKQKTGNEELPPSTYALKDSLIFEKIMAQAEANQWAAKPLGNIAELVGKQFTGRPYTAKTLEVEVPEKLVINLHEFDCTTFMENSLALAKAIHQDYAAFGEYMKILENMRYRNGQLAGYLSRLHYYSDWLYDNEQLNIIKDVTAKLGGTPVKFNVNFMSNHPDAYKQLSSQGRIDSMQAIEKQIAGRKYFMIPEDKISQAYESMKAGDIAGFVTDKEGLDIAHVGLLTIQNNKPHLMHASMDAGKVIISAKALANYVKGIQHMKGIVIARLVD